jgi:molybdopterin synthase sulfur carrier subunit
MVVKFFAYIRDFTGSKEINIDSCLTLRELLDKLCRKYGEKFSGKVLAGDKLRDDIIIMVNGRHILHLQGLETNLEENDEISIFPKVAGG